MTLLDDGLDDEDVTLPESVRPDCFVHPCAEVDHDCEIGERTKIWQFASVIRKAKIGADCNIASCAIVDGSRIGNRCLISHGAFIDPGIVIGNNVFIGPGVKLCNDAWPRVEKWGFHLDVMVSGDFVTIRIDHGASLGAGVIVKPGITIGASAMIAAGAVVDKNVPAGHLYKPNGEICVIATRDVRRMRVAS